MNDVFYGNTVSAWIAAAGIAAAVALALYGVRYFIQCRLSKMAEHTETKLDDILLAVLGSTYFAFILLAALYIGSLSLALPAKTALILSRLAVAGLLFQAAMWGDAGIRAGNLSIAAQVVLGADNITVSGTSSGTPVADTSAVSAASSGASNADGGVSSATAALSQGLSEAARSAEELKKFFKPTFISAEVIGHGDCEPGEKPPCKKE